MTDVLKLAEEALERASTLLVATRDFIEANPVSEYTVVFDEAECDGGCLRDDAQVCNEWQVKKAITAIRTARAEWGWRKISEMAEQDKSVVCGKWIKMHRKWEWVTQDGWGNKKAAQMSGYTHFYRLQLPPPPTREEVGNG